MHKATDAGELSKTLAAMIRKGQGADALLVLSRQSDPVEAASAILAAVNTLYRSFHDVEAMVLAAHIGASWCLGQANLQSDPESSAILKSRARAMSYNAAANCWPGWGDEGVTIDDGHVAAALPLAGMCCALAEGLGLGAKALGTSHWLVGALELALGRLAAARAAFQEAERSYAALGEEAPQTLMARAYDALAAKYDGGDSREETNTLEQALERLTALGTEDGRFFAEQVGRAEQMFDARRGA